MSDSDKSARKADPVFGAAPMGVIRLATLPRALAAATRVDLEPDREGYEERLAGYLVEVTADPVVREALAVSSGSLTDTIAKVESGRTVERAKLERAVFAATRYLLRMTGRPTPFGLMAGVQRVEFADRASAEVGDRHSKSVRPDNAWLSGVLDRLRHEPKVRDVCRVVVNNLCTVRGDRVILQYVRPAPGDQGPESRELTVRLNPLLSFVIREARRPVGYADLRAKVLEQFPEAGPGDADRVLGQLIDKEILLTDLLARRDAPDLLDRVNTQLAAVDEPGPAALRRIGDLLTGYRSEPLGSGLKRWRATLEEMDRLHPPGERSPVQVDLRVDADVRLPYPVATEMADVGEALWRMAPPGGQPEMQEYHGAFLERYGLRTAVPVLDLLDPHIGLGPPAGYLVPRGERTVQHDHDHDYPPERENLVAERTLDVIRSGGDELVLDDALVDRLAHDESVPPTLSFDLCVEVHANSVADLDRGRFRLHLSAGAGSVAAGAMVGRFSRMLGADEALAAVIGEQTDGPLLAQLYYQPRQSRNDNVSLVPQLLPRVVPVGTFADPDAAEVIDVGELAVAANEDRFYLTAAGREVVVITPHMLEFRRSAPNVARFLASLMMSGTRSWAPWDWGRLDVLPHLPRVRYQRTVLASGRWRVPTELADRQKSWREWQEALQAWRENSRVPDVVRVAVFDNHVDLDLTVPLHQQLLRHQVSRSDLVVLRESGPRQEGWLGGHANEVVLSLVSTRGRSGVAADSRPVVRVRHEPGGEWLFAKVYAIRDTHDALLRREIAEFTSKLPDFVDRWFFMRYVDPDAHLRLRFHGPAERLNSELLPMLSEWVTECVKAGSISRMVLDGYEPETSRYGSMDDAERLFQADSESVISQLQARSSIPIEVLAAMNYVELLGSLGDWDWDWQQWVLDTFPMDLQKEIRTHRQAAFRYVDPVRRWAEFRTVPGAEAVLQSWQRRADVARRFRRHRHAVEGVLHMHANRLIGMDRDAERVSYGILRTVVRNHVGRMRSRG